MSPSLLCVAAAEWGEGVCGGVTRASGRQRVRCPCKLKASAQPVNLTGALRGCSFPRHRRPRPPAPWPPAPWLSAALAVGSVTQREPTFLPRLWSEECQFLLTRPRPRRWHTWRVLTAGHAAAPAAGQVLGRLFVMIEVIIKVRLFQGSRLKRVMIWFTQQLLED